ncbi:Sec-independent protein translocase protein TatCd [Bacillus sp. THAF10]|uniref:twin-arginine translocase subunit TatC n=1 Tax=Bacillus sp. THAF10 TaxID=2587848 RepID=UPI001268E653|nr:twin-arginine translocase subunit TatC [Bacillus sp. THAF10]QFT87575.1 Sec-independent protein translocase protein TatCd [Bacillus sp. THAF10]
MEQTFFLAHIAELRKRLVKILLLYVLIFLISFFQVGKVYEWLMKNANLKLTVLGPSEILWVYFMLASICALAATIPFAAYQVWAFTNPALKPEERKSTAVFIPVLFFLFLAGVSFGYWVVFPKVFNFVVTLSEGMFETMFTAEKYFRFLFQLTIPLGLIFELPALVWFLTKIGLLTPMMMTKYRKFVYLAMVIVSAILTPPDLISQTFVLIPLILLYESSIMLCGWVYKKRQEDGSKASFA